MYKKNLIVIFVVVLLFIAGGKLVEAESNFYGMVVYDSSQAFNAFDVYYNDEGGVSYTYTKSLVNTDISCWGDVRDYNITYTIENNTESPIELNYYADVYELATVDGSVYELEMPDILDYPSKVINPNNSATITFDNPVDNPENIMFISASLGLEDKFIFLKRIQEKKE
jgi:hypothetical protein